MNDPCPSNRFGRVLGYAIVGGKNVSVELARQGLVKVTIYQDRRKLKYQDELLKAQEEAKKARRGIWK
ncbi:MAG: thermonuclease family protein [Candidatus Gottesmanbacteria bacterium]|nr:thermonuclease family protein [Candidatus Gottesmanbacteria bacterium]